MNNDGVQMTKLMKVLLILCVLVVTVCSAVAIWYMRRQHDVYTIHPIRPKDFPEILIAPEHTEKVDYSSPSTTHRAPRTYSLSFVVNDPYPSKNTRNFIEQHLISNGWQHLNYLLLNPDVPVQYSNPILYQIWRDINELDKHNRDKGEWPLRWRDDWLNKNNEHISIFWGYVPRIKDIIIPPTEENLDLNRLEVNMTFFERDSWVRPHILRYKELHPEEFKESKNLSDMTGGRKHTESSPQKQ